MARRATRAQEEAQEVLPIPDHHKKIAESFGWKPEEYWARIRVLENDGVTLEQLAAWRREHGQVFRDSFMGQAFYYRMMTRPEHRDHVMNPAVSYERREEIVCSLCTLHPAEYDFENGPAGIPHRLMELILDHSGFVSDGPTLVF